MTDNMIDFWEQRAAADPAFAHSYADQLRRVAPTIVAAILAGEDERKSGMPERHRLTRLQVAVFDNWRAFGGEKPKGKAARMKGGRQARHKVTVEAWTTKPTKLTSSNRAFAASGIVFSDLASFTKHAETVPQLREGPEAWQRYRADLEAVIGAGFSVAPLYRSSGNGRSYMLDRCMVLTAIGTDLQARLTTDAAPIEVQRFEPSEQGNVAWVARLSSDGGPWATGGLDTSHVEPQA